MKEFRIYGHPLKEEFMLKDGRIALVGYPNNKDKQDEFIGPNAPEIYGYVIGPKGFLRSLFRKKEITEIPESEREKVEREIVSLIQQRHGITPRKATHINLEELAVA